MSRNTLCAIRGALKELHLRARWLLSSPILHGLLTCALLTLFTSCSEKHPEKASDQTALKNIAIHGSVQYDTAVSHQEESDESAWPSNARFPKSDFDVAGLSLGVDSATVIDMLGPPLKIQFQASDEEPQDTLTILRYKGFFMGIDTCQSIILFDILERGVPTARGVMIGDSVERVRQLYGQPTDGPSSFENALSYSNGDERDFQIKFYIEDSLVIEIYLGPLYPFGDCY